MPTGITVKRTCPICNKLISRGLWKHFWKCHGDSGISDAEFLRRVLGLDAIPKCISLTCDKDADIDYHHYAFKLGCCFQHSCGLNQIHTNMQIQDPDKYHELQVQHGKKSPGFKNIHEGIKNSNPEYYHEMQRTKTLKAHEKYGGGWWGLRKIKETDPVRYDDIIYKRNKDAGLYGGKSKIELDVFGYIKNLLPRYEIISQKKFGRYRGDIYIRELNLLIEVDGVNYHDFDSDLKRDKFIYKEFGVRIRRLDAEYLKNCISDSDLLYMINLESHMNIPYWNRVPYDQLLSWKWNIYQIGSRELLTYEVKSAK